METIKLKGKYDDWAIELDVDSIRGVEEYTYRALKDSVELNSDNIKTLYQKIRKFRKEKINGIVDFTDGSDDFKKATIHFIEGERRLWTTDNGGHRKMFDTNEIYVDNKDNWETIGIIKGLHKKVDNYDKSIEKLEKDYDKDNTQMEKEQEALMGMIENIKRKMLPIDYQRRVVDKL